VVSNIGNPNKYTRKISYARQQMTINVDNLPIGLEIILADADFGDANVWYSNTSALNQHLNPTPPLTLLLNITQQPEFCDSLRSPTEDTLSITEQDHAKMVCKHQREKYRPSTTSKIGTQANRSSR
jgi:hypothetical protein